MPKQIDDLTQENPLDSEPEDTSMAQDLMAAYAPKAQRAAGDYARRSLRRMLWGLLLSFTLSGEYERDRQLDRLERGEKIGYYELFFGAKFSVFKLLRMIIFLAIVGGIMFYIWRAGVL